MCGVSGSKRVPARARSAMAHAACPGAAEKLQCPEDIPEPLQPGARRRRRRRQPRSAAEGLLATVHWQAGAARCTDRRLRSLESLVQNGMRTDAPFTKSLFPKFPLPHVSPRMKGAVVARPESCLEEPFPSEGFVGRDCSLSSFRDGADPGILATGAAPWRPNMFVLDLSAFEEAMHHCYASDCPLTHAEARNRIHLKALAQVDVVARLQVAHVRLQQVFTEYQCHAEERIEVSEPQEER